MMMPWPPFGGAPAMQLFRGPSRLMAMPGGGFPVPGAVPWKQMPPVVQEAVQRIVEGPPKPCVTPQVMSDAQFSMIAPDLPTRANV